MTVPDQMIPATTRRPSPEGWARSLTIEGRKVYTVSGSKWYALVERCREGGIVQKQRPEYVGCVNEFEDFNQFVAWHRQQISYGMGFEVDKDLLVPGNRVYRPDRCCLLPAHLNKLVSCVHDKEAGLPPGVSHEKRYSRGKYKVRCSDGANKSTWLGYTDTPEEGFALYKRFKESLVREIANQFRDRLDPRAYAALQQFKVPLC